MKAVVEEVKAKKDNQKAEIKESVDMRLEQAFMRRLANIEEKIGSAKKTVSTVSFYFVLKLSKSQSICHTFLLRALPLLGLTLNGVLK